MERNKGLAGYDRTHNFQAYWAYNLPFGKDERWATSGWTGAVFGGWQLNGIWTIMSGTPIYIVQNSGFNLNAAGSAQVPDLVKGDVATYPDNQVNRPAAGADANPYQYLRSKRLSGGQHSYRPAAAVRDVAAKHPARTRLLEYRSRPLPLGQSARDPRDAVPLRVPQCAEPSELLEPWQQHLRSGTFGFITSTTGVGERNIRLGVRLTF